MEPGTWPLLAGWGDYILDKSLAPERIDLARGYHAGSVSAGLSDESLHSWRAGEIALINEVLAQQLGLKEGDELILRVRKPSALALDAVITPREETSVALRFKVGRILSSNMLGDFSLSANQLPPANAFVPLEKLAGAVGLSGRANLLVSAAWEVPAKLGRWDMQRKKFAAWLRTQASKSVGSLPARLARWVQPEPKRTLISDRLTLARLNSKVERAWLPEDAQLQIRAIEPPQSATGGDYIRPIIELSSSRIFLEPAVVAAALTPRTSLVTQNLNLRDDLPGELAFTQFVTNGVRLLTYLANVIRAGERAAPYSMVTAASGLLVPADLRDDEVIVNEWLAEDLQVKPGAPVQLSYYLADSASRLVERTNTFRVRSVVPLKGRYADRTLMPEFPGIAKAESTHDWDAGFPLVHTIRDKDEAYWKQYRGTPKAFITLAAGQKMWANRFGTLTAIRYEVPTNGFASTYRDTVYRNLLANLKPSDFGLSFEPVRDQALTAANQAQDFGQLFLGFSIFLVVAALLLVALLFQLGLEQRAGEVGTLLALGFTARQVRQLFLIEGGVLALAGGIIGALAGLGYARAMLWGLTTLWRSAVSSSPLDFYATPVTLLIGVAAGAIVALLAIWLTLRRQVSQSAHQLLAAAPADNPPGIRSPKSKIDPAAWLAAAMAFVGLTLVVWAVAKGETANAGAFFGAGALFLVAGLAAVSTWLRRLAAKPASHRLTIASLGMRGSVRRRKRSLVTIALLACGCFVIVAIGVFRLDANRDASLRTSGTGGFAFLGQSTLPIVPDLNTMPGREAFGLSSEDMAGVAVVPLRLREGDEASCLNLNRAQKPRLLGVNPGALAGRFTFANAAKGLRREEGWNLLKPAPSPSSDEIPAIGDANSIQWALGKKLGDTVDYTDEYGRAVKLRLVGAVANSILQGNLLIDEAEFVKHFPGESGYRMFLIDAPSNSAAQLSATLSRALQDLGLELTPTVARLNAFNAVQNTYLGTFQILGGLGLLLGSAGLGVVVLRNVLERRGELGLLLAVGFRPRALQHLVLSEHAALLVLGLGIGIAAAAVAVLPALLSPGAHLPYASLAFTLAAILLNGFVWAGLATRYALRGNLLAALRNE